MTETLCEFCRKKITGEFIYHISLMEFADTSICEICYEHYAGKKEVKYTKYTRWEIIDI